MPHSRKKRKAPLDVGRDGIVVLAGLTVGRQEGLELLLDELVQKGVLRPPGTVGPGGDRIEANFAPGCVGRFHAVSWSNGRAPPTEAGPEFSEFRKLFCSQARHRQLARVRIPDTVSGFQAHRGVS